MIWPKIRLSISRSLILLNTVLIVMTGLTVMFFSFTATKSSIHSVADNLLGEISKSVLTKTQAYLLPAERAARSVSWLLWNRRLDADTGLETLLDYYQELLQNNAEFRAVYSGDTAGNLVMRITLLGAAGGEVTGSAYLVETKSANVLIDCGMTGFR